MLGETRVTRFVERNARAIPNVDAAPIREYQGVLERKKRTLVSDREECETMRLEERSPFLRRSTICDDKRGQESALCREGRKDSVHDGQGVDERDGVQRD